MLDGGSKSTAFRLRSLNFLGEVGEVGLNLTPPPFPAPRSPQGGPHTIHAIPSSSRLYYFIIMKIKFITLCRIIYASGIFCTHTQKKIIKKKTLDLLRITDLISNLVRKCSRCFLGRNSFILGFFCLGKKRWGLDKEPPPIKKTIDPRLHFV